MRPKKRFPQWPEITNKTTWQEFLIIHKRIWDYVIRHGRKPKTPYFCNCAACEYSKICCDCILDWGKARTCAGPESVYDLWFTYNLIRDENSAKEYAKRVRMTRLNPSAKKELRK